MAPLALVVPRRVAKMRQDHHLTALKAMQTIILSLAFVLFCSPAYGDRQLLIPTEEWPPYNFMKDGEVVGLSTDLVKKAVLARAEINCRLEVWPRKRAYTTTLKQPYTLLYTTSRTAQREHLFKWIGPLYPRQLHLFKLKSRKEIRIDGWGV
ncbi:MAG: hypothetical protein QNJ48_10730 [Desulfobacterales bacterium]|nr:hypothetical protein [Desulfobacterales bacterium]